VSSDEERLLRRTHPHSRYTSSAFKTPNHSHLLHFPPCTQGRLLHQQGQARRHPSPLDLSRSTTPLPPCRLRPRGISENFLLLLIFAPTSTVSAPSSTSRSCLACASLIYAGALEDLQLRLRQRPCCPYLQVHCLHQSRLHRLLDHATVGLPHRFSGQRIYPRAQQCQFVASATRKGLHLR